MEVDGRIEALEGDFKLMKGQLKETLTSVRDFLLTVKPLPPATGTIQEVNIRQQLDDPDGRVPDLNSDIPDLDDDIPDMEAFEDSLSDDDEIPDMQAFEESPEEMPPQNESGESLEYGVIENEAVASEVMPSADTTISEEVDKMKEEKNHFTPQVNLLANLIRWISTVKRELGREQLPAFLGVYGITRPLSTELKDVILHLAEVIAEPSVEENPADIWSRLTLELHGILVGCGVPLVPPGSFWCDEQKKWSNFSSNGDNGNHEQHSNATGADKAEDRLAKLKIVLSTDNGPNQEFDLTLTSGKDLYIAPDK